MWIIYMTCFWDGIISSMNKDDLNILGVSVRPSPSELVNILKNKNIKTLNINWEGTPLRFNEIEENFIHINDFSNKSIQNGYLCSICDPFLCLLVELLKVNINHTYLSHTVHYTVTNPRKTFFYMSNRGHFWKQK